MVNINLKDAPRDIKRNRDDENKYAFLRNRFKIETDKEIFKLALRIGFFKDLKESTKPNPKHLGQLSTFSDDDIREMVLVARYGKEDMEDIFDGKKVINTCEEYANGGIIYLYNLFSESNKEDIQIIEDIVESINKSLKEKLFVIYQ